MLISLRFVSTIPLLPYSSSLLTFVQSSTCFHRSLFRNYTTTGSSNVQVAEHRPTKVPPRLADEIPHRPQPHARTVEAEMTEKCCSTWERKTVGNGIDLVMIVGEMIERGEASEMDDMEGEIDVMIGEMRDIVVMGMVEMGVGVVVGTTDGGNDREVRKEGIGRIRGSMSCTVIFISFVCYKGI